MDERSFDYAQDRPIRIGVIGCGMIAQIMHLPYLQELPEFETAALCDISSKLLNAMGDRYKVDQRYSSEDEMFGQAPLDAVVVLNYDHHPTVVNALRHGLHVLVEKPMCNNLREADEMIQAAEDSQRVLMVAYNKRYDPGYEYGVQRMRQLEDVRYIEVRDFIGPNDFWTTEVMDELLKPDDLPAELRQKIWDDQRPALIEAVGDVSDDLLNAYGLLLGLSTHDMSLLLGSFGPPREVINAHVWRRGTYIEATLDYGADRRCLFLTGLHQFKHFDERLIAIGRDSMVTIEFPMNFDTNRPTLTHVREMEGTALVEKTVEASHDEGFRRELKHFAGCIRTGARPQTDGLDGRENVNWLIEIIKKARQTAD